MEGGGESCREQSWRPSWGPSSGSCHGKWGWLQRPVTVRAASCAASSLVPRQCPHAPRRRCRPSSGSCHRHSNAGHPALRCTILSCPGSGGNAGTRVQVVREGPSPHVSWAELGCPGHWVTSTVRSFHFNQKVLFFQVENGHDKNLAFKEKTPPDQLINSEGVF